MSTQGMTVEEANDFMALEPRLVELVRQAVQGMSPAVHVLTSAEIADVLESKQRTPAVHIIYGGFQIFRDQGLTLLLDHTWFVVSVVSSAATARSGQVARLSAGRLAARVVGALYAARVPGTTEPLSMISPPPARYSAGLQYLPTAFMARTVFHKPQPQ